MHISIILGTTRQGRQTRKVADFVYHELQTTYSDHEVNLIDVSTLDLSGGEDGDLEKANQEFIKTIETSDAFIIVSPEYNHSFPGSLKSALDICYDQYKNKAVGFVGVSSGAIGGARMIEQLNGVAKTLGLKTIRPDLHFGVVQDLFAEDGTLRDNSKKEKLHIFMHELLWLSRVLKEGRNETTS